MTHYYLNVTQESTYSASTSHTLLIKVKNKNRVPGFVLVHIHTKKSKKNSSNVGLAGVTMTYSRVTAAYWPAAKPQQKHSSFKQLKLWSLGNPLYQLCHRYPARLTCCCCLDGSWWYEQGSSWSPAITISLHGSRNMLARLGGCSSVHRVGYLITRGLAVRICCWWSSSLIQLTQY